MLARHATLVAERAANPLWNQARGAAPRRVHYPPHPVGVKVGREASMDDRDDGTAPATDPFSPDPSGGFERGADERRRPGDQVGVVPEGFQLRVARVAPVGWGSTG